MIRTVSFNHLIGPHKERAERTRLTPVGERGIAQIFGGKTPLVAEAYYEHQKTVYAEALAATGKPGRPLEKDRDFYECFAHQIQLGAVAANSGGELYELGCGVAIPSIVFSLVTGKRAVVVDNDPRAIEMLVRIAREFGVKGLVTPIEGKVGEALAVLKIGSNRTVLVSNPVGEVVSAVIGVLRSGSSNVILDIYYAEGYESFLEGLVGKGRYREVVCAKSDLCRDHVTLVANK